MKEAINWKDYAPQILEALGQGGTLLTTQVGDKVNTMTIGWGTLGIDWRKPVFQAYVRESRHTKGMLDEAKVFTVNVPLEKSVEVRKILAFCGSKSGRDLDKVKELGLTLEPGETVAAPAIKELPLTLECKVIYQVRQEASQIPQKVMDTYYPNNKENPLDLHTVYYGEITAAYIVK